MNTANNLVHSVLGWLALLIAAQAPITAYLTDVGVPVKLVGLAFGGVGLIVVLWHMRTDSQHDAQIVAAQIAAQQTGAMPSAFVGGLGAQHPPAEAAPPPAA